jgi:hypothetical protein
VVLPARPVDCSVTGFVAGAASAAAREAKACLAVPAEPAVSCLVAPAPALIQHGVVPETSLTAPPMEIEEALVGLVLVPSVAVIGHLAARVANTCR